MCIRDRFNTHSVDELVDRVVFPIRDVLGRNVVFVGRHALSNGNPRYVNYPRGTQIPLFPVVLEDKYTSIILVEGMMDMLNLYDKGIHNAVSCFGTSTLKGNAGPKLLPFKAQGVTKIYIMFDGDTAGREAAAELKPIIEECGFEVQNIDLPDDTDPGDLSQDDVDSIKEYIK
jgi:DNA primase